MASVTTARPRSSTGGFDPFRAVYRLLTSVRFALLQLAVVAVAALLGVFFPQVPDPIRLNPPSFELWLEGQRETYGVFTEAMRRAGLFTVFHSVWFNGLLVLLLVSVAVCTVNRFSPIWRTVRRPLRRVNDRYFETAHARAVFPTPADPAAVEDVLRRKRYKVETVAVGAGLVPAPGPVSAPDLESAQVTQSVRYLFADRFSWAQFATFASHLSLILFLAGGAVSKLVGFQTFVEVGEGGTQPVFPVLHENQMQVQNLDSIEGRDEQDRVIDYRTALVIYHNGVERCRGEITVNGPLHCNGYRFHQATYTPNGAALQVRDRRSGQVVLAEAPILQDRPGTPSPHVVVRDAAGAVLLDEYITMGPVSPDTLAQLIAVDGKAFAVSGKVDSSAEDWQLDLFYAGGGGGAQPRGPFALREGERASVDGYTVEFAELRTNPWEVLEGMPGTERPLFLQMARDRAGTTYLDVVKMGGGAEDDPRFQLEPGGSRMLGDYEYTFQGPREYTGVLVKRDPGSWLIWSATALLMAGLFVTFYVPRRRLWVKITPERTYLAGIAERTAHLSKELEALGEEMNRGSGQWAAGSGDRH